MTHEPGQSSETDSPTTKFKVLAHQAATFENEKNWEEAVRLWFRAYIAARRDDNTSWARSRMEFCQLMQLKSTELEVDSPENE